MALQGLNFSAFLKKKKKKKKYCDENEQGLLHFRILCDHLMMDKKLRTEKLINVRAIKTHYSTCTWPSNIEIKLRRDDGR